MSIGIPQRWRRIPLGGTPKQRSGAGRSSYSLDLRPPAVAFFTSAACPPACAFAVDDVGEIFRHAEHAVAHAGNVRAAMADLDMWLE